MPPRGGKIWFAAVHGLLRVVGPALTINGVA